MKTYGSWLILAAAVCWGSTGTAQAFAPSGAQPAIIGAARLAVGSLLLLAYASYKGVLRQGGRWPILPTLTAGASMAAYQLFFFAAVLKTGVAVGTIVAIGSAPVLAGLIGYLARGEHLTRSWALATLLAVAGCSLLTAAGAELHIDPWGLLLAACAGASYAVFAVASKGLLDHKPPEAVMAVAFVVGAVLLSPLFLRADLAWLAQPRGIAVILHLGFVTTALAYTLFAQGLRRVPVATAATLSLGEPLTAGLLGVVLLGERLSALAVLGILMIFAGLALITLKR